MKKLGYNLKRIKRRNKSIAVYNVLAGIYDYKCALCGWSLPYITPNGKKQKQGGCDFHHIVPFADGGEETPQNLILLCPNCHKRADVGLIPQSELYYNIRLSKDICRLKREHKLIRQKETILNN